MQTNFGHGLASLVQSALLSLLGIFCLSGWLAYYLQRDCLENAVQPSGVRCQSVHALSPV